MRLNRLLWGILPVLISSACVLADKTTQHFLDEGNVFLASGKFNDALENFDAAIAKDPSNYLSYFRRATTYLSLGRNSAALDDFSKILQLKPDFEQALLQRAKTYLKEGQFELATKDLKKYLKTKPKDDIASSMLESIAQTEQEIASAENKLKGGEYEECIQLLSSAINTAPQLPKVRLLRAQCHIAKGEIEEAAGDFSRAANINPSDRELLITLATMNYYSLYEPQVALAHIKQCLHYDPEDKACKALFRKFKKYEKDVSKVAEDLANKRLATVVNKLIGSGERIGLITEVNKEVDVVENDMNAVGKMPRRLQLKLYQMACRTYSEQKDQKNALKWCGETLKIDENDTDALMSRGEIYLNDELYEEAVRELNKANESASGQNRQVMELLNKAQRLLKQSQTKDYYKILGVSRQADKREIKKAYRKLAQMWHPDKYTGDLDSDTVEKKMSEINQAYEVLNNDEMRAQFDNGQDPYDASANQSPFGHGGGGPFGGHPFGGGQFGGFPQGFQFEFKF